MILDINIKTIVSNSAYQFSYFSIFDVTDIVKDK